MFIRISQGIYEADKKFFTSIGLQDYSFRGKKTTKIDLRKLKIDTLRKMQAVCSANPGAFGVKAALKDIATWLNIQEGGGSAESAKCRSLEQFVSLMSLILHGTKHRWIFHADSGGRYLPYFVSNISLNHRTYGDGEQFVSVKLHFFSIGERRERGLTLYESDVNGKTVQEALLDMEYVVENPDLVSEHEQDCELFDSLYDKIGLQMIAEGTGSTNVSSFESKSDHYYNYGTVHVGGHGVPERVVIDIFHEGDKEPRDTSKEVSNEFWEKMRFAAREDVQEESLEDDAEDDGEDCITRSHVPTHPNVVVYSFAKSARLSIHVRCLEKYEYRTSASDLLVIPEEHRDLINMLVDNTAIFRDVVDGKSGGAVILCSGHPGTGKTLTAEVYSETSKRPLFSVQCSQLGIEVDELEKRLGWAFNRAKRWQAIMLLDEADVYVRARGDDLIQNAIVGVFLRVLEYYDGVLFMTTNRSDLVDDAISSRCIARIDYTPPDRALAERIWKTIAKVSGNEMSETLVSQALDTFPGVSGRDIKNLIKLGAIAARRHGKPLSIEHLKFASRFKPSVSVNDANDADE